MTRSISPEPPVTSRVGIVGGGQLARMMAEAAPRLGLYVTVLDPTPDCPAHEFAAQLVGEFDDATQLAALARAASVITLDIEAVTASCLEALEHSGTRVAPSAQVLGIIQDKLRQKEFLRAQDLPTSNFREVSPLDLATVANFGIPSVLKARRHGYDGRGVKVVRRLADAEEMLNVPCLVEHLVDIDKELAVMVARSWRGEIATYPVVEAKFDSRANILDLIQAPASVSAEIAAQCTALARRAVESLDGVGIFGIEFFLARNGEVLINEISPRPHNSGHYTIEACATSQFEQHLRAVTDMPLGPTTLLRPAASFNLLGEPGAHGRPDIVGLATAHDTRGAVVHLYGKHTVKPFRKMGHVTVTGDTLEEALATAHTLQHTLKVMGVAP
jgi:5-(carboxyamino)imidazole ribonucleotide synthase